MIFCRGQVKRSTLKRPKGLLRFLNLYMAFDKDKDYQRQMYKGNWKCSECGVEITELPFEPDGTRPIYCRDCWRKRRQERFRR